MRVRTCGPGRPSTWSPCQVSRLHQSAGTGCSLGPPLRCICCRSNRHPGAAVHRGASSRFTCTSLLSMTARNSPFKAAGSRAVVVWSRMPRTCGESLHMCPRPKSSSKSGLGDVRCTRDRMSREKISLAADVGPSLHMNTERALKVGEWRGVKMLEDTGPRPGGKPQAVEG